MVSKYSTTKKITWQLLLSHCLPIYSKHRLSQTVRVRDLTSWENVHVLPPVMCHVSCVAIDLAQKSHFLLLNIEITQKPPFWFVSEKFSSFEILSKFGSGEPCLLGLFPAQPHSSQSLRNLYQGRTSMRPLSMHFFLFSHHFRPINV